MRSVARRGSFPEGRARGSYGARFASDWFHDTQRTLRQPCAHLAVRLRFPTCHRAPACDPVHAAPTTTPTSASVPAPVSVPAPTTTPTNSFFAIWDQKSRKLGLGCGEAKAQDHSPSSTKAKAFAKHQVTALLREIPPADLKSALRKGLISVSPKPQNSAKPIRNLKKAVCWGVFLVFWRGNCVRTPSVDRAHSGALVFRCPASCPALFRHLYKGWFSRLWPDGSVCGSRHLRQ